MLSRLDQQRPLLRLALFDAGAPASAPRHGRYTEMLVHMLLAALS